MRAAQQGEPTVRCRFSTLSHYLCPISHHFQSPEGELLSAISTTYFCQHPISGPEHLCPLLLQVLGCLSTARRRNSLVFCTWTNKSQSVLEAPSWAALLALSTSSLLLGLSPEPERSRTNKAAYFSWSKRSG